MIECLKFLPLVKALTIAEEVPLVHLSEALSTAIYNITNGVIHVEISNHKTSITKPNLCKLLGLALPKVSVDPELIPTTSLIEMFYQMGYNGDITLPSKFRKPFLPPMWNGLFTLLFKSLPERVSGSDNVSKMF